ncbi:hypothetical protein CLM73_24720 [Achromobacter spanius]|uniref:Uncharacterized protein n=1 Tax=Achromobacter spanius TaxID=217203 RepID=A0A2S0IDD5_9BURK|nr:hypothetical protein CLM73_24720 [Achromobacter spanius]
MDMDDSCVEAGTSRPMRWWGIGTGGNGHAISASGPACIGGAPTEGAPNIAAIRKTRAATGFNGFMPHFSFP